jgi:RNA polymerase-binding transcription factor DksA
MDGILLESVEGLGHSPFVAEPGEIWEQLQTEKEEVSRHLLSEGSRCAGDADLLESEASEEYAREIRWLHRGQLEGRLREVNDALDRLIDGAYGRCIDCREEIDSRRLMADPAAARCVMCQRTIESEGALDERSRTHLTH